MGGPESCVSLGVLLSEAYVLLIIYTVAAPSEVCVDGAAVTDLGQDRLFSVGSEQVALSASRGCTSSVQKPRDCLEFRGSRKAVIFTVTFFFFLSRRK